MNSKIIEKVNKIVNLVEGKSELNDIISKINEPKFVEMTVLAHRVVDDEYEIKLYNKNNVKYFEFVGDINKVDAKTIRTLANKYGSSNEAETPLEVSIKDAKSAVSFVTKTFNLVKQRGI